jgi:glycosyltransferase involved in cell wall biosynthesis
MSHANLVVLLAKKISGVGTRIVVSERENPSVKKINLRHIRSRIIDFANRYFYKKADVIHAVSSGVGEAVAEKFRLPIERVKVVYNPIDHEHISQLADEEPAKKITVNCDCRTIVSAGRLSKQKDYRTLIKALFLVRKTVNVRLLILGEGEMRGDLERLISELELEDHVALPGFFENPFPVMKHADLFVLSSIWEGLPNVLIQSMACGTPVVSTDCPSGPSEILENGKWGRLVPVGDVNALSLAIIESLNEEIHPDIVKRAGEFSIGRGVAGYLGLLFPDYVK